MGAGARACGARGGSYASGVRRFAILLPIAAVVGVLIAWRRRSMRATQAPPLAAPPSPAPLPAATEERFVSVPWTLVDAPRDRAELTVRCVPPAAMELDRVDAQETPTQVFVTTLMRRRATGDADVALAPVEATVPLSGPLGPRELVHAPVDDGGEPGARPLYP